MTVVFGDSFYFLALANNRDTGHRAATAYARDVPHRLVTTIWVLFEVADGLAKSLSGRARFLSLYGKLMTDPNTHVEPYSDAVFLAGLDLYARRPDKGWSLTDCTSFVVMDRDGLTGDHHFTQAGFTPLLASSP